MMRNLLMILFGTFFISSCSTEKKLSYLSNVNKDPESFEKEVPDYKIQTRDILYVTIKSITSDGTINDFLSSLNRTGGAYTQSEAGQYIYGYDVNDEGDILLPVLGYIKIAGSTIDQARIKIQNHANQYFSNTIVECKLLSFKFTVIGEVKVPGTYVNYNNYLTVLEAIGRAGGVTDFGRRDKILVVRPISDGSKTYTINLQDKSILSSEAYYLQPNDVVIVEPERKKIFNLNLPTFTFIITSATSMLTSTLLLINFFNSK